MKTTVPKKKGEDSRSQKKKKEKTAVPKEKGEDCRSKQEQEKTATPANNKYNKEKKKLGKSATWP